MARTPDDNRTMLSLMITDIESGKASTEDGATTVNFWAHTLSPAPRAASTPNYVGSIDAAFALARALWSEKGAIHALRAGITWAEVEMENPSATSANIAQGTLRRLFKWLLNPERYMDKRVESELEPLSEHDGVYVERP